jgi:ABC-2 type transport system permease protein
MSELSGLYAIWEREIRIYFREKSRLAGSIVSPLLWLFLFGTGMGSAFSGAGGNFNYQTFLFPGIITMTVLFTSIFYGAYVVMDKRLDFLKEVLVSPVSRTTIFFGKVLGGVTDAIIQATILMVLAPIFGIPFSFNLLLAYVFLFLMVTGLVSIGLIIGSLMDSPEGFSLIMSFLNFPLFFLSGALFPLDNLPSWLLIFTRLNPVTYGVDAMRQLMTGMGSIGLFTDLIVLIVFATVMIAAGTWSFGRMKL